MGEMSGGRGEGKCRREVRRSAEKREEMESVK